MARAEKSKVSGTREWAVNNVNCVRGCAHNCAYCYARFNAVERFKWLPLEQWPNEEVRWKQVNRAWKKMDGVTMFPTTHDITPGVLKPCLTVLKNLLTAGNQVLVVSKPHLECIRAICAECEPWKGQLMFRFTIGAYDDAILKHWDRNAPLFGERLDSLKHAFAAGYKTSVSVEPMLDADNVVGLVDRLIPFVTDSLWIGKMNRVEKRVAVKTPEDAAAVKRIVEGQTDEKIRKIYEALKDRPLVKKQYERAIKWKESIKEVLGLDLATEPGLDI